MKLFKLFKKKQPKHVPKPRPSKLLVVRTADVARDIQRSIDPEKIEWMVVGIGEVLAGRQFNLVLYVDAKDYHYGMGINHSYNERKRDVEYFRMLQTKLKPGGKISHLY
jgi:hypothetical protein